MALRECPECGNPISTAATACPKCGCPLRAGKRKQSYLGPLLLTLAILVVFATFYGQEDPAMKHRKPVAASRCDTVAMKRLVQQALDNGILHRVDGKPEVSRVYVLEPWTRLTIDEKKGLDAMLKCTVTQGTPNDGTIVVYHDGKTGKELATSNRYGFTVE